MPTFSTREFRYKCLEPHCGNVFISSPGSDCPKCNSHRVQVLNEVLPLDKGGVEPGAMGV